MKIRSGTLAGGVLLAGAASGPFFVLSTGLATLYLRLPHPIILDAGEVAGVIVLMIPAFFVGAVIGTSISAVGANVMVLIGSQFAIARPKPVWTMTGLAIGIAFAKATGMIQSPEAAFGFIATCTLCAWLCSRGVEWVGDGEQESLALPSWTSAALHGMVGNGPPE